MYLFKRKLHTCTKKRIHTAQYKLKQVTKKVLFIQQIYKQWYVTFSFAVLWVSD